MSNHRFSSFHPRIPNSRYFSESSFWSVVKQSALAIGRKALYLGLTLFYAFKDEHTPKWAKTIIAGALGYLILPLDAIPDFIPGVGFTDDLGAIVAATAVIAAHITAEHRRKAARQVDELFENAKRVN
jgi:uncharacterized membrane protein YkvA (DUF1232 family)